MNKNNKSKAKGESKSKGSNPVSIIPPLLLLFCLCFLFFCFVFMAGFYICPLYFSAPVCFSIFFMLTESGAAGGMVNSGTRAG
ncbi:hypothetical protein ABTX20_005370 [Salmonella enterica]